MTELDASESTIRRDLNTLDANGQLIKVHGGAILKNTSYSTEDDEVMQRRERNKGAKEKIAKYAAGLIEPGDFVYIDAFSTPELKEALVKKRSMENCRDCYILADDSKFNQISSVTFAPFESAKIITTGLTKPAYRKCKNVIEV